MSTMSYHVVNDLLKNKTKYELANWYHEVNSHKYPGIFSEYHEQMVKEDAKSLKDWTPGVRHDLLCLITYLVDDEKFINRQGNLDMTDEEHNDFWAGWKEGDEEAEERNTKRTLRHVASKYGNIEKLGIDWSKHSSEILEDLCELFPD